jgi:uncharacterized repeat protein (TIGR04138 family)
MLDPSHPIAELLQQDRRYTLDAYAFVFEALTYAQKLYRREPENPKSRTAAKRRAAESAVDEGEEDEPRRHVTGQELCEAIRRMVLEQYGYMAKTVLNSWGIRGTGDFGEIVFNLIRIGQMRKTARDQREDFDDVFDFDTALKGEFRIRLPE